VESDFPINLMLQWEGWLKTKKKGFIHTYEKFTENIK